MEISKNDEREFIVSLIKKVAEGFNIEAPAGFDFYSRNELIDSIKSRNEKTAELLKKFLEVSGTYRLVRHDQEMKIKAKEIWEYQYNMLKPEMEKAASALRMNLLDEKIEAGELIDNLSK